MMFQCKARWHSLPLLAVLLSAGPVAAQLYDKTEAPAVKVEIKPADVQELSAHPQKVSLLGRDDAAQIILTAKLATRLQDLTTDAEYESANEKVVRVTSTGRIIPVGNGATEITAKFGNKTVKVPVQAEKIDVDLPINFGNQIVPIFTKLGCNSGGCHGKASGQNGFKLSLLGFEPETDYAALVMEARGRRLFPASPENSLLLLKAAGIAAHAGGKRLEVGSDEWKLTRRWIASGTPFGSPEDPIVERVTIFPEHRIMTRQNKQQFAVYAHYSDGRVEDITRRAQYESNDTEIAVVDESGLVRTLNMSGEAAIMARYQGNVTVFRATVPTGMKLPEYQFPQLTVVDKHTQQKWQQLGLVPSGLCTDEEFLRRVSIDITGTLPTPEQIKAFVADKDAKKRDKLVDALVDSQEYSYYFARKWADILHVTRQRNDQNSATGTFAFHAWIREAMANDKPYDEFARDILTATGDESRHAPTVWYKTLTKPEQFVDDTAQVFLGLRMACAQCHHHPYEKWSQDDYWGLAAYFGQVGRKNITLPGAAKNNRAMQVVAIYNKGTGGVTNKRNNQPAVMKPLDGKPVELGSGEDPRQRLVDWMSKPDNPFFARAIVNRYWAHFFGRGIVDPLDDMRVTNPPSNPALLDALAKDFVDNKFSLKHLVKTICKSRTYQLSSIPNEFNKNDKQAYARYYPKRLSAEVLFDAVCQVTNSPTTFSGLPQDRYAPKRAIMLPDSSYSSYFLDVFGRPQGISACECERVAEANLAQALHLLNSDEVQGKISRGGGRADLLAKDMRPDEQKIEELFYWAFAHKPTPEQLAKAVEHVKANEKNKKMAYENILWALINTKEFVFNK